MRASAFIPFLQGDTQGALDVLFGALGHAERARPGDHHEELVYAENRQTLLQTIAKTWELAGRYDKALEVLQRYAANDPLEVGVQLELGEAYFMLERYQEASECYLTAAILGPPGDRIGTYLAGRATYANGRVRDAALLYLESLNCEPMGVSPREALAQIAGDKKVVDFAALERAFLTAVR
jgi:tetratricopeptide (TPR) repeat protein